MFETESVLNAFMLNYAKGSIADLTDEQWDLTPIDGFHSIRWIFAHLAIAADMGLVMLGQTKECPSSWHVAYGINSAGVTHEKIRPSSSELIDKVTMLYPKVCHTAQQASEELLRQPHPLELLRQTPIQTKQQLVSHLLTTHFASHIGQLSAIRRQLGYKPLF